LDRQRPDANFRKRPSANSWKRRTPIAVIQVHSTALSARNQFAHFGVTSTP
jgi:hypothetical protein